MDDDVMDEAEEAAMLAAAQRRASSGRGARKPSFAHSDVLKYRRAFDAYDQTKSATIRAADLGRVMNKLGYKFNQDKIDVSRRRLC